MEKDLFTDKTLGDLVRIKIQDESDWAFNPSSLPNEWETPAELWPMLAEAREELARLDGIGRHMPNYAFLLRPLQHREALKSSSLEGIYATPVQLLLFEIDPKEPKTQYDQTNAWKEVSNYNKALRLGQRLLDEIPVSLRLFRALHRELLTGVRGHHRDPGNFRKTQVHIGSDRRFIPPPASEMVKNLNNLEEYIHKDNTIDPLIFCFMVHYQFETIHPFLDGNGRVGRLLLSLMIYQWCKLTSPWLYLSAFFDKYKDEYINNLFNVSAKGDWKNWIAYCLRATLYQAKDAIRRFDKLVSLKEKYSQLVFQCGGNIRLHTLIESLFEAPMVTAPQLAKKFNISYPTAKNCIGTLINLKILIKTDLVKRPVAYIAPEIINIAYQDIN